jgi:predicted amidohydrolase
MPEKVITAAIQMDAKPAPTAERLSWANSLVMHAAQADAQLVVLPELFNTGYSYSKDNFDRAEMLSGLTAAWMKATALPV